MQAILQFNISRDAGSYTAERVIAPIVTFGTTFEELQYNIREAVQLFFDSEEPTALGFRPCSQPFRMGVKLKVLSGEDVLDIFERFGFFIVSQRGDHVKLRRTMIEGAETLLVPFPILNTIPCG